MYGEDDNRIIVYNMERWLKKKRRERRNHWGEKIIENNPLNTVNCIYQKDIIT